MKYGWATLLLVAFAAGCSGGLDAQVSGVITLDDQPLTTGTVTFHPADGNGAVAYGQIDSQGRYTLNTGAATGIASGMYKVTVVATGPIPEEIPGQPPAPPPLLTPPAYGDVNTTELSAEVKAGKNELPFKLKRAN